MVRPKEDPNAVATPLPPGEKIYLPVPDRWNLPLPEWDRYGARGDYPYVSGHWWDPYNQNALKGDYPVFGTRTFFAFTGVSDSLLEGRNLPVPSGVSTERPGSERFFGRGGTYVPVTSVRASFDLFRGDTVFRPVDWRVRAAPAYSANFVNLSEYNGVNADVRRKSTRLDHHLGFQELFAEKKLFDIGHHYDFVSVRAGIQEFTSDFRGFLAVLEAPGVRVFGTLKSSRVEYNAAVFDALEKDTNSGFNEMNRRRQQIYVANVYVQDFLAPGYTQSFSFHANDDRGELHYDRNGFLVRPAPIGVIGANRIKAYYIGESGSGHIGRWNVSHAFYQALGHETSNPIAAQRIRINAQMGALELSIDKDWLRIKGAAFIASGDGDPSDGTGARLRRDPRHPGVRGRTVQPVEPSGPAPGADGHRPQVPAQPAACAADEQGRGAGELRQPRRLHPERGRGRRADAEAARLRHDELHPVPRRTAPMEALLFQGKVRPGAGVDVGGGATYRPPLSDNIVIIGGVQSMKLGQGLKDIYERSFLFSIFVNARLQF